MPTSAGSNDPHPSPNPPSAMAQKPLLTGDGDVGHPEKDILGARQSDKREGKETYFFYGTLMDPGRLQRILGLKKRPQLKTATVIDYHMKMWGPYPALLDGPPGNVVSGLAWEVEGCSLKDRLAQYETDNYKESGCSIQQEDGGTVQGVTFIWAGDEAELEGGSFDLEDWKRKYGA